METQDIVIGIDGGGTHTRVMVSDLSGKVLSYIEKGSAWAYKEVLAVQNVKLAIVEGVAAAGRTLDQVRGLAAGIAGYDSEADLEWVKALTAVDGLDCPKWHFNDAVAAHYGGLLTRPGIVALSGTGAIVMALTEAGETLRNYDFYHYTGSGARFLSFDATYEALAGNAGPTDQELIQQLLAHWRVSTLQELSRLGQKGFIADRRERDRKFEQFTPLVTTAASQGSALARRVCDKAIYQLKVGIELLAPFFSSASIPVAFIGSVINSEYFKTTLSGLLTAGNHKPFTVVQPRFSPVTGSVLYALSRIPGQSVDGLVAANLEKSAHTKL